MSGAEAGPVDDREIIRQCGALDLVDAVRSAHLSYLTEARFAQIVQTIRELERNRIAGDFIEAGCALGGSTIVIAGVMEAERRLSVYDVFGMIPPPTEDDPPDVHERYRVIVSGASKGIGGKTYYGYVTDLKKIVEQNLKHHLPGARVQQVALVEGLVQDSMEIAAPVAFAHLDVDWYEPVLTCLQRIYPRLSPGGSIIVDDYSDWGGCRNAVDEYLATVPGTYEVDASKGNLKITKL